MHIRNYSQISLSLLKISGHSSPLCYSGHVPLPRRRMYWEQSTDVHNEAVAGAMSLNRFEEILRYLPSEADLDIDKSMVPNYGHHSSKQFIRGKPIQFGFEIWCLNTRLGYLNQFDPCQGSSAAYDRNLGNIALLSFCYAIVHYIFPIDLAMSFRCTGIHLA